jgi:Cd2+/Zn2+-exporting ATPase
VQVSKIFGESTVSKILSLVENAGERKSKSEHFITRFAKYYTPSVVVAAVLLAILPPLFINPADFSVWSAWIYRAMSFLVVSCPCALVISVPLSFFGGIGGASRQGVLIKGSNYLEALANCNTAVFDKTGTLTEGRFAVSEILPAGDVAPDNLLRYAAGAEAYSSHPIARALREAVAQPLEEGELHPATVEEIAGHGVKATVGTVAGSDPVRLPSRQVLCGNRRLMESAGVTYTPCDKPGTVVYVALDGVYAGCLVVADQIKADAAEAMAALRACGVTRTVMLTGDGEAVAGEVARQLGISEYRAGLLPGDKVDCLESILQGSHQGSRNGTVAFVGDGINDAPVLARADVGIAMGGMGSDAAIEAADVVLMDDKPSSIAKAMRIARRTLRIVRQNIVFALSVKAAVLILVALGVMGGASMWIAVFADVGVAVLAILNAMRAMRVK